MMRFTEKQRTMDADRFGGMASMVLRGIAVAKMAYITATSNAQ